MEPLMPDECVAQHEHHLSQVAALEAMWAKRLDSVVDDNRVREEGLKSENLRLQGVAREQRVNRLTQLKGLSDDVAQFSHRHKNQDSMISVPFLLQHLERLTNGLVAYPEKHIIAAPDTPAPSQIPARKRRFGEDVCRSTCPVLPLPRPHRQHHLSTHRKLLPRSSRLQNRSSAAPAQWTQTRESTMSP